MCTRRELYRAVVFDLVLRIRAHHMIPLANCVDLFFDLLCQRFEMKVQSLIRLFPGAPQAGHVSLPIQLPLQNVGKLLRRAQHSATSSVSGS